MIYAITLKKTRKPILLSDYEVYLKWLTDKGYKVEDIHYETTKGLHCHFILDSPAEVCYSHLKRDKFGWNIKHVPIYYRKGWEEYIRKDQNRKWYDDAVLEEALAEDPRPRGVEPGDGYPEPPSPDSDDHIVSPKYPRFDIRKLGTK